MEHSKNDIVLKLLKLKLKKKKTQADKIEIQLLQQKL